MNLNQIRNAFGAWLLEAEFDALPEYGQGVYVDYATEERGMLYDERTRLIGRRPGLEFREDWYSRGSSDLRQSPRYGEYEPVSFQPIDWIELSKREFPAQLWLVPNLIPAQGLVMVASPSGEKKSWVAMDIARSVALGENFLGSDLFPTKQVKVLYIDGEMSTSELVRRGKQLRYDLVTEGMITLLSADGLNLNTDEGFDKLSGYVEQHGIGLVVIDTLRAVAGGMDESKAEVVRAFMNRFKVFKNKSVAVIFLDHTRKPTHFDGNDAKKEQLLGSQDKVASIEVLIMLKSEERSGEVHVYPLKNRLGKELKPFTISMEDSELGVAKVTLLMYQGELADKVAKTDEAMVYIPFCLADGSKTTQQIIKLIKEDHSISEKLIRDALKALVARGKVSVKEGRPHIYSLPSKDLVLMETEAAVKEMFTN